MRGSLSRVRRASHLMSVRRRRRRRITGDRIREGLLARYMEEGGRERKKERERERVKKKNSFTPRFLYRIEIWLQYHIFKNSR